MKLNEGNKKCICNLLETDKLSIINVKLSENAKESQVKDEHFVWQQQKRRKTSDQNNILVQGQ